MSRHTHEKFLDATSAPDQHIRVLKVMLTRELSTLNSETIPEFFGYRDTIYNGIYNWCCFVGRGFRIQLGHYLWLMIEVLNVLADDLMLEMWRSTFPRNTQVSLGDDNDLQVAKNWEMGVLRQIHFREGVIENLLWLLTTSTRTSTAGHTLSMNQNHLLRILTP